MQVVIENIPPFLTQTLGVQRVIFGKKISEVARDVALLLKKVRLDKGLSQLGVAETIGISLSSYSRYERGLAEISFDLVIKLANAYKLSLDEFYTFGEPKYIVQEPESNYEKMKAENEELRKQLDQLNELNESNKRLLKVFRNTKSSGDVLKSKK